MGKYYCCMTSCSNYKGRVGKFRKEVTLHKLPKDRNLRSAWIRAISRKHWKPTSYTRVCSDHFVDGVGPCYGDRHKIPTENLVQKPKITDFKRKDPMNTTTTDGLSKSNHVDRNQSHFQKDEEMESYDLVHFHSYCQHGSQEALSCDEPSNFDTPNTCDKDSQTSLTEVCDERIQVVRPEITIDDIKDSDSQVQFYTGLPNYTTFRALFESLVRHGADRLSVAGENLKVVSKRKLRLVDEFFMVLMRLRLGLLVRDLEYRFKISSGRISLIFDAWINLMSKCLKEIVFLPTLEILKNKVPKCFEKFADTRIILDCTEVFVQTPSSLDNKSLTYSNYKSHNTYKALVGISMTGAVVFVSKLWGGMASDVHITRESGLLEKLETGDAVMVDKGFVHLGSDLKGKGIKLYCPPLKKGNQLSKSGVELTRRIASARTHVERKMEQIKNFRILQGVLPLSLNNADAIFFVCCALTNLMPPLIK